MKRPDKYPLNKTKVYHITCSRDYGVGCLYFWGCTLRCRLCLLKKEAFDCLFRPNTSCFYGNEGKTDLAYPMERIF
jgi:hypothetical protein